MVKKNIIVLNFLLIIILLAACSGGKVQSTDVDTNSSADSSSNKQKEITLKLGHVGPAEVDHPWEKFALEFADKVNEATDGKVKIETYPASQLGADRVMTESLQQGTLEMGLISTIAMGNFVPELQLWDLPYIFPTDNSKVDEILEGEIGDYLAEKAAEKGLRIIAYWENDWRSMTNSVRPIESVEDLKGLKMRVVENQPSLDWFERIGSLPTPMAFSELYTALQQGTIDGQDNGAILSYGSKLYEPQKYFTITKHMYAPLAVVVSEHTWSQLTEETQKAMQELAVKIGQEQRPYSREVAEQYIVEMEKTGIEVTHLTEEALQGFRESAEGTYEALADTVGQEYIDKMLQIRDGE